MTALAQIINGILIGIVQGISEWLPISSKTQVLIAAQYLLHLTFQQAYTFGLFMEIGTIIAAIIYFRKELFGLIEVLLGAKDAMKRKLFVYILVTIVLTGIIGAPLYLFADSLSGIPVGVPLLIIGIVLLIDAAVIRHSRKKQLHGENTRKLEDLSTKDFALVGIAQGIAALPGVSRSGITTSALLLMKVEADEAFRLSFLTGIFAAIAAFALTLVASHTNVSVAIASIGALGIIVAIITATVISLFLIDFLIKIAGKSKIVYVTAALGLIAIASGVLYLLLNVPHIAG